MAAFFPLSSQSHNEAVLCGKDKTPFLEGRCWLHECLEDAICTGTLEAELETERVAS